MKFFAISLTALVLFHTAVAADFKSCEGLSDKHTITLAQTGPDVEVNIDDVDLHSYRELGNTPNEKYKMSGKIKSTMVLHDIALSDFMKKRALATEFIVMTIMGRPEYQGEEDMLYSYASDYLSSLKCQ